MRPATIIVPVYGAGEQTETCVRSIIAHTPLANDCQLLLIDDCTPEPGFAARLDRLTVPGVTVLRNDANIGYTRTVNRGIQLAAPNDVLLLNSDTQVTPNWWQKMRCAAYAHGKVGTVTPVSNCAGAFSVPYPGCNKIPARPGLAGMARLVEECGKGKWFTGPTGNGFCLYIRRELIEAIGLFDELNFPKGYGEENDFCMRGYTQGFQNIITLDTFIFHEGHASFKKSRHALLQSGLKRITILYPDYPELVKAFAINPVFMSMRACVRDRLLEFQRQSGLVPLILARSSGALQSAGLFCKMARKGFDILISQGPLELTRKFLRRRRKLLTASGRRELASGAFEDVKRSDLLPEVQNMLPHARQLLASAGSLHYILDHNLGGGARSYMQKRLDEYLRKGDAVIYLAADPASPHLNLVLYTPEAKLVCKAENLEQLATIPQLAPHTILVNELINWIPADQKGRCEVGKCSKILAQITAFAASGKARLEYAVHDYFSICPSYMLIGPDAKFCGLPDIADSRCQRCFARKTAGSASSQGPGEWRMAWRAFLNNAGSILCFSAASRKLLTQAYPEAADRIEVLPHSQLATFDKAYTPLQTSPMTIAIAGNISEEKGAGIILEMEKLLGEGERIVVLGECKIIPRESHKVILHGPYQRAALPELLGRYRANIGLIPSVWPETFNYVAQEFMQLNLPLVSFDLGAHGERIKSWARGKVAADISADSAYAALKQLHMEIYGRLGV